MLLPVNITRQIRVVLTTITLLLMVGLNNREVTTFVAAPEVPAGQQIDKSAAADHHGTVKQKVSFEATSSYLVLQLTAAVPELLKLSFVKPVFFCLIPQYSLDIVLSYFKTLLSTTIQVNAP